ncbi:MAG: ribosomal L7Ae/L30e/S12e/Gadd45 family protein [Anaerostipes sp.]|nr:ribosomal L7Ae/L30e/S12e/Gadd45 family protein [Anaerostipes sp.]
MNDKVLSLLGLATRSRHLVSGEFSVEASVKAGKGKLVIVAKDASDNAKKQYTNMCNFYKVPLYFYSQKDELGHAIGKDFRVAVAVEDEGFANSIRTKLDNNQ